MLSPGLILLTRRCWLRQVSAADFDFVWDASRHPGFCDGMAWEPPAHPDELLEPFRNSLLAWEEGRVYTFTILRREDNEPLGRIGLRAVREGVWSLGYWIHPCQQGRGYATECGHCMLHLAFHQLDASAVQATHATWNIASRRVMEKMGLSFMEHRPEGARKRDAWVPQDALQITRENFTA